tara:strand:- start:1915 stop:2427 length:513 start_codon:yes stop_codon:yes gene_type:complete
MEIMIDKEDSCHEHFLLDKWVSWAHLPQDNDWSLSSYKKITTIDTLENACRYIENFPDNIVKNCMLFFMREGINPFWEDPKNINGGCFSYKVNYKCISECWKNLSYLLVGETITNEHINKHVNGITISPKKNFCIIKIWFNTCDYMDVNIIKDFYELPKHGAFFKKHITE